MFKNFLLTLIFVLLVIPLKVFCLEKKTVSFSRCIDGDTAEFIMDEETVKVRFLAVNTPEIAHGSVAAEDFGNDASNFTCSLLENASVIELEQDNESDEYDKYGRYLAWVFVDDSLLQEDLIENGLAKVAYLYGDYKYTSILEEKEIIAQNNKIGLWGNYTSEESNNYKNYIYYVGISILVLLLFGKKKLSKYKKKIKKFYKIS